MDNETKTKLENELKRAKYYIEESLTQIVENKLSTFPLYMSKVHAANAAFIFNNSLPEVTEEEIEECEHSDLDPMEGCLDCGKAYHEVADMDPDLDMER